MSVWAVKAVIVEDRRCTTGTSIREYRAHDPSFFPRALLLFHARPGSALAALASALAAPHSCTLAGADGRRTQNTDTQRLTA